MENFKTDKVNNMSNMFNNCKNLTYLNILDFKVENRGFVYYYLCEDYYALGEHNEALKCINQALLFEQSAKNYYAKANVLEALGRIKESKECFEKYNELS